ncbi:MAG: hypothetical protein CO182_07700 [Lysobacterales bacterium CG_4_9_14_3_um_filter_62_6]|nr:MAG: hypothetical protein CO182_07700 [Xanthomonadales bacterium CG_4_9_14_3_um_filter_62_6]
MRPFNCPGFAAALLLSGLVACSVPTPPPTPPQAVTSAVPDAAASHRAEVERWRQGRLERLQKPDGWLSLIGLHWLGEGEQSFGSASDNDIVLAAGPAHFGRLRVVDGAVQLRADPSANAVIEGAVQPADPPSVTPPITAWTVLAADTADASSVVRAGTVSFVVIDRGGRLGLRVRDTEAPHRQHFAGIDAYPVAAAWRFEADWTATPEAPGFQIQTVIGTIEEMPNPGYASFSHNGHDYRIYPVIEKGEADLFIIFADRTNGKETYGPGRFFYAPQPQNGKLILDFNKAYNPPCAFSDFSTCPLPPPENRLDLAVTAGEKKYRGTIH